MIPASEFSDIEFELERRPLETNYYRKTAGLGRSQAFGLVNRRCRPIDYSRQCWIRPELYKMLLDFGERHVTDISWNCITVNQNYTVGPHKDRNNIGQSYLIAFGEYTGGHLKFHHGELTGSHDVFRQPLIADFGNFLHSVEPWEGNRYSLVYYQVANTPDGIPPPSFTDVDGIFRFKRGDLILTKKNGLPHPLKGYRRPKN
jgi:hypothetical protein